MTMRQRRVLITGGAGFVGSHLCERLLLEGARVVCVDNYCTGIRRNIEHLPDLGEFTELSHDVTEPIPAVGRLDVVVHLACPASPAAYGRMPIETLTACAHGTRNCLELARAHGARFVLASTSEVYGEPRVHPQPETYWGNVNPIGPRSAYDEGKRYAEALTVAYRERLQVDTGIVRLFNCYGPRLRPNDGRAIPTFIAQALRGEPLTVSGDGTQTRSPCYVDDTVAALVRMIEAQVPGPVNLGNPEEVTVLDLALRVRDAVGSDSPVLFVPRPVDDPSVRLPNITLARNLLGWEPTVSLDDGLKRTVAWFREIVRPSTGGT